MMKIHKIGATLNWAGTVALGKRGGPLTYPDLTGWAVAAAIKGRGFVHALRASLEIDDGKTTLRLQADSTEQSSWRAGEVVMDVRLTSPDGDNIISRTAMLRLAHSITE